MLAASAGTANDGQLNHSRVFVKGKASEFVFPRLLLEVAPVEHVPLGAARHDPTGQRSDLAPDQGIDFVVALKMLRRNALA